MDNYSLHVSVVLYRTSLVDLETLLYSLEKATQLFSRFHLTFVDHSPASLYEDIAAIDSYRDLQVFYIHDPANPGYGAGHNRALIASLGGNFDYHLVLNPDVCFHYSDLAVLLDYMESNSDVALSMPRVVSSDGLTQSLCKLLPTPFDLISRLLPFAEGLPTRFNFFAKKAILSQQPVSAPYLSGCFMLLRCSCLSYMYLFDPRFFLYPEDLDLSRRLYSAYDCHYVPHAVVQHRHEAASKKNVRMFLIHACNMLLYFLKWGYFFDPDRVRLNSLALKRLSGDRN